MLDLSEPKDTLSFGLACGILVCGKEEGLPGPSFVSREGGDPSCSARIFSSVSLEILENKTTKPATLRGELVK